MQPMLKSLAVGFKIAVRHILTSAIALVWLINGLFCKVLNLVPRHELIVSRILGSQFAEPATKMIGVLEIAMVFWILSGIRSRWCVITQVAVVAAMNVIEYILVPDLLLFGRLNILVAICFMLVVLYKQTLDTEPATRQPVNE